MNIQWYPGHMVKAQKEVMATIKLVDLVIELKDARIPYSSTNPLIDTIIGNKPRLILLCKSGLADKNVTKQWLNFYKQQGILALDIDAISGHHIGEVAKYAKMALNEVFAKRKAKGIMSENIKAVILGIPNVGKSTLINTLAKRKATAVGNKPGVTKMQTWIKAGADLQLLDTPGILWPKFDEEQVGVNLAICGCIKEEIYNLEEVAYRAVQYLMANYAAALKARYGLNSNDPIDFIRELALKRGYLFHGGEADIDRTVKAFMNELRTMKIGAISYERPE